MSTIEVCVRPRELDCEVGSLEAFARGCLSYLPAADTEKEAQDIRLLLLLELFDVFEGTHLSDSLAIVDCCVGRCSGDRVGRTLTCEEGRRRWSLVVVWNLEGKRNFAATDCVQARFGALILGQR